MAVQTRQLSNDLTPSRLLPYAPNARSGPAMRKSSPLANPPLTLSQDTPTPSRTEFPVQPVPLSPSLFQGFDLVIPVRRPADLAASGSYHHYHHNVINAVSGQKQGLNTWDKLTSMPPQLPAISSLEPIPFPVDVSAINDSFPSSYSPSASPSTATSSSSTSSNSSASSLNSPLKSPRRRSSSTSTTTLEFLTTFIPPTTAPPVPPIPEWARSLSAPNSRPSTPSLPPSGIPSETDELHDNSLIFPPGLAPPPVRTPSPSPSLSPPTTVPLPYSDPYSSAAFHLPPPPPLTPRVRSSSVDTPPTFRSSHKPTLSLDTNVYLPPPPHLPSTTRTSTPSPTPSVSTVRTPVTIKPGTHSKSDSWSSKVPPPQFSRYRLQREDVVMPIPASRSRSKSLGSAGPGGQPSRPQQQQHGNGYLGRLSTSSSTFSIATPTDNDMTWRGRIPRPMSANASQQRSRPSSTMSNSGDYHQPQHPRDYHSHSRGGSRSMSPVGSIVDVSNRSSVIPRPSSEIDNGGGGVIHRSKSSPALQGPEHWRGQHYHRYHYQRTSSRLSVSSTAADLAKGEKEKGLFKKIKIMGMMRGRSNSDAV